jgi:hypothetical protein
VPNFDTLFVVCAQPLIASPFVRSTGKIEADYDQLSALA